MENWGKTCDMIAWKSNGTCWVYCIPKFCEHLSLRNSKTGIAFSIAYIREKFTQIEMFLCTKNVNWIPNRWEWFIALNAYLFCKQCDCFSWLHLTCLIILLVVNICKWHEICCRLGKFLLFIRLTIYYIHKKSSFWFVFYFFQLFSMSSRAKIHYKMKGAKQWPRWKFKRSMKTRNVVKQIIIHDEIIFTGKIVFLKWRMKLREEKIIHTWLASLM